MQRVVGWLSHWRQMMLSPKVSIWRPRQAYIGEGQRDYQDMHTRVEKDTIDPKGELSKVDHIFSARARL